MAFPVFTKVLSIDPQISRTFGLMMQSVGMSMAALFIVSRGIKVLPRLILWVSVGGIFGHILGTYFLVIPNPYPRILITLGAAAFAGVLMITHWWLRLPTHTDLPTWSQPQRLSFIAIGVVGGLMAAHTGSGIDLFTFIVLTLAFGIDERISVPTTVIIMALNSLLGFGLQAAITRDTGVMWNSWLVAIPIVAIGAPFGAYVASCVSRNAILIFLLSLIALETITTIWLIPFSRAIMTIVFIVIVASILSFWAMLAFQYKSIRLSPEKIRQN